jgi:hypothetical protein
MYNWYACSLFIKIIISKTNKEEERASLRSQNITIIKGPTDSLFSQLLINGSAELAD